MSQGCNVDPTNHPPEPRLLRELGFRWVRFVARTGQIPYAASCMAAGLKWLAVITPESLERAPIGYYREWFKGTMPTAIQIGNEMDAQGISSSSMSPREYADFWQHVADGLGWPDVPLLSGGMASGIPHLAGPYLQVPRLSGLAVHPYAKTAEEARALLGGYRAYGLPLWVTEWHRPEQEIAAFAHMLRDEAEAAMWFCWSDHQTLHTEGSRMGLVDEHDHPKRELFALSEAIKVDVEHEITELQNRVGILEQRDAWKAEALWRLADGDPNLRGELARLAKAMDPEERSRPR